MQYNIFKKCLVCTLGNGEYGCVCGKTLLCEEHKNEHFCKKGYVNFAVVSFLLGSLFFCVVGVLISTEPSTTYKHYQIGDKNITCTAAYSKDCGMALSNCWDGNEYTCTQNVIIKGKYVPNKAERK